MFLAKMGKKNEVRIKECVAVLIVAGRVQGKAFTRITKQGKNAGEYNAVDVGQPRSTAGGERIDQFFGLVIGRWLD